MSRQLQVVVEGKEYPCRLTMGALLDFKRATGKEVSSIMKDEEPSVTDTVVLIYSCIKASCRKDSVDFPYSLEEFADSIEPQDLVAMASALNEPTAKTRKKK